MKTCSSTRLLVFGGERISSSHPQKTQIKNLPSIRQLEEPWSKACEVLNGFDLVGYREMASEDFDSMVSDYEYSNETIPYEHELAAQLPFQETLPTYVIFMLVLYTVVFIVGFFGNCIVIYGVMQQGPNKTTSSFLIANLALSDLAVLVLSLPVGLLQELASWPFGELACKIFFPLGDVFLLVSIMTLTIISVDRYRAVVTPKKRFTKGQAKVAIVIIWILSYLICGLPTSFLLKLIATDQGVKICYPFWPNKLHRRSHMIVITIIVSIPFFIIAYSYFRIVRTLWKVRIIHKNVVGLTKESHARLEKKRKLVKMLILIVIAFTLCSLPYIIYVLILEFGHYGRSDQAAMEIGLVVVLSLFYTNSAVNPLILCAMSKDYRKGLRPFKC